MDLRWSRGCGTGIGLSAHKNEYPSVVAINNFLEDRAAADKDCKWHRFGNPEPINSTYRAAHNRTPEQVAAALGNCTAKIPREILKQDKGKQILFEHLGPRQKPPATYVSLNSLTYAAPFLEKRHVQKEMWCGDKAIDLGVTCKQPAPGQLTADKAATWTAQEAPERCYMYTSTARGTQMHAALLSNLRAHDPKAAAKNATAAPDSGCQQPTVGRKVKGDMSGWIDQKERFINMLDTRQPIDYTVKFTCKDDITGNVEAGCRVLEAACDAQDAAEYGTDPATELREAQQNAVVC